MVCLGKRFRTTVFMLIQPNVFISILMASHYRVSVTVFTTSFNEGLLSCFTVKTEFE